jgi:F0F1-type ATP synthase assembly protein I
MYNIPMETKNKKETTYRLFLIIAMSTSIVLVSPVIILVALGFFVDSFFHTTPLYTALGGGLGFISGIVNVFRMMQMMQRKKREQKKQ